jgi:hypothetical protein
MLQKTGWRYASFVEAQPIAVAWPPHGIRFARTDVVAKVVIEQFLAIRSGAGPWPVQWLWLVAFVVRGRADAPAQATWVSLSSCDVSELIVKLWRRVAEILFVVIATICHDLTILECVEPIMK